MFRKLCERYHCLPTDLEECTYDQIFILAAPIEQLERIGVVKMSLSEARSAGIVKPQPPGTEGMTLVQRIRAKKAAEQAATKKLTKRERRLEQERMLREARERGEV